MWDCVGSQWTLWDSSLRELAAMTGYFSRCGTTQDNRWADTRSANLASGEVGWSE